MNLIYQSKPRIKFQNLSIEEWKNNLLKSLKEIPGFTNAYFFGSFARGEDEPWSDVDIIIVLEERSENSICNTEKSTRMDYGETGIFFQNLVLVSKYISDYPELEPIVYTTKQWDKILTDPEQIGFWKDVRRDLQELVG